MAIDGRLNFDTKIDTKGFSKGLGNLYNQINSLKNVALKASAALGLAFSSKAALEAAAEINAANSQMTQTFGNLQSAASKAMQTVADNSSIMQTRLQNVGTSIYAFAKTTGMDSVSALNMMSEALQVTADSAAYYDRSLEDTAESLKSFLKGNFENDAALGLSCTETTRNTAANKLYGKSYIELSEAQKQLTLLQMVKDANALSGAEGQAAREAEGWENVIGNLKESWRQLLGVVGQPILSEAVVIVKNLTSALNDLTSGATAAVNALAKVFNIQLMNDQSGNQIADSSAAAADNYADMATAAEDAQKANENSLASFDQINKLSDNDSVNSESSVSPVKTDLIIDDINIDTTVGNKKFEDFFSKIKSSFDTLFDPFKQAWDSKGSSVIDSIDFAFNGVWNMIKTIGKSFADVWGNGTGSETVEHLLDIWTNINNVIGNVSDNFSSAWSDSGGIQIVQNILDIMNDMLDTIENITDNAVDLAQTIDFSPLISSFENVTSALKPLSENIFDGIEWFWDNVLLPMAGWTITNLIPSFLDLLAAAIDVLNSAVSALKPLGKWLWDKFLEPIASWTGGVIITAIKGLTDALKGVSDWIQNHQTAVQNLAIVIGTLGAAFAIAGVVSAATAALTAAGGIMGVLTPIATALGAAINFLTSPITLVILAIGALIAVGLLLYKNWDTVKQFLVDMWDSIKETLSAFGDWFKELWNGLTEFFSDIWQGIQDIFSPVIEWFSAIFQSALDGITTIWSVVTTWFSDLWNGVKNIFSAVGDWFGSIFSIAWNNVKTVFSATSQFFKDLWTAIKAPFVKVADWFKNIFSKAWQAVKNVFSTGGKIFDGIKEGIAGVFTSVVNGIIGGINKVIATPLNFLNNILNNIRDIEIAGFTPFDSFWDYDPIPVPQIPKLANGAVIPPNSEFLAILGDQKRGTNIEAPLDTITQAVMQALVAYGGAGGNGNQKVSVTIPVTLNGRVITQMVIDNINDLIKCNGKSPIIA